MKPSVDFHRVTGLRLSPVQHYPAECRKDGGQAFWARDIYISDGVDEFRIQLFSYQPGALLTPEERRAMERKAGELPEDSSPECETEGARVAIVAGEGEKLDLP